LRVIPALVIRALLRRPRTFPRLVLRALRALVRLVLRALVLRGLIRRPRTFPRVVLRALVLAEFASRFVLAFVDLRTFAVVLRRVLVLLELPVVIVAQSTVAQDDLALREQHLERMRGGAGATDGLREAHQRCAQPQLLLVEQLDEPQQREPTQRRRDLATHVLLRHAFVVAAALVPHRGGQVVRAHHRREVAKQRRARDDPTALEGLGIEVQQRQTLADDHLGPRQLTPAQSLAGGQQEEVAVGAMHELATEAPVKLLEHGLRLEDERVPRPVVAIDVPSTSQREVHVGEVLVEDRLADLRNSSPLHQASSSCDSCHCSIASWASMRTHGRSRSATGRRSWARPWAIRPAIRKCSDSGTPSVQRAVISERSW